MGKTSISIDKTRFRINEQLVYSEITNCPAPYHGLLMNARFIQGIFDDLAHPGQFARFGKDTWDPEENTNQLIQALPKWQKFGLRAFTVGFQGGGPCFTVDVGAIENNPFGRDGKKIDPRWSSRMDRLIRSADDTGMVVIVSFFYPAQITRLDGPKAVEQAVRTAAGFLREAGYTNVIIEIANEVDMKPYSEHLPGAKTPEMIRLAREVSGGMPVGCSLMGGRFDKAITEESDVVLIHGNGTTRQQLYELIHKVRSVSPDKPVVCNEDSNALGQLKVAFQNGFSWGYYNNLTKQEPPADWNITRGEDLFFATRMAEFLGIPHPKIPAEDQIVLQGFEKNIHWKGNRWPRVAALYPEKIDYVEFFINQKRAGRTYDEPFTFGWKSNWSQTGWIASPQDKIFSVAIHLRNGEVIEKQVNLEQAQ